MDNLANALAEVKHIEAFERSRYRYNHPIFAHVTAAIALLEAEVAERTPPPVETVAELKAEETEAEEVEEIEKPEGFTQASRRARR
jgi:hypothetical protein